MDKKYYDRARGMLIGLAVGDALGAPVEFGYDSESIAALGDKIEHFQTTPFGEAGTWTDDTSMALCLADSLLECGGYDSYDIMDKFSKWAWSGYRTPDGYPAPDIGVQTRMAIDTFYANPVVPKNAEKTWRAGNGSIMRLAPVVIANTFPDKKYPTLKDAYRAQKIVSEPNNPDGEYIDEKDIKPVLEMASLSCRETHNATAAEAVTEMFAAALHCALHGLEKNNIANYCSRWLTKDEYFDCYQDNADKLIDRAMDEDGAALCDLGGYIVDAFAIAMWGFLNSNNFKDGMMMVICLGGDTDTNAAIYGQLAGAYYGYGAIPKEWREGVFDAGEIVKLADDLLAMKTCPIIRTRFEDDKYFKKNKSASNASH